MSVCLWSTRAEHDQTTVSEKDQNQGMEKTQYQVVQNPSTLASSLNC